MSKGKKSILNRQNKVKTIFNYTMSTQMDIKIEIK